MSTTPVTGAATTATTASNYVTSANATPDQIDNPDATLGKNDFLDMLVTQLKNQDPTTPVDDSTMLANMAQFSSLEQMTNLNSTMTTDMGNLNTNLVSLMSMDNTSQAASLIGKTVIVDDGNGGTVTGAVTAIKFVNGQPTMEVNGNDYQLSAVQQIQA
jgi:flagellar basal-body rod modification protein FlgD